MAIVDYELAEGIATITLNRPKRLNALNAAMFRALGAAWRRFEEDRHARIAVLQSSNDRAFCAGLDLKEVAQAYAKGQPSPVDRLKETRYTSRQNRVSKPVVGAVNGICCGGGLSLALDCDLVVVSLDAEIFDPHVDVGLVSPLAGLLPKALPLHTAKAVMMLGGSYRLGAAQLVSLGVACESARTPTAARSRALEIAKVLDGKATQALVKTRNLINSVHAVDRGQLREIYEAVGSVHGDREQRRRPVAFATRGEPDTNDTLRKPPKKGKGPSGAEHSGSR